MINFKNVFEQQYIDIILEDRESVIAQIPKILMSNFDEEYVLSSYESFSSYNEWINYVVDNIINIFDTVDNSKTKGFKSLDDLLLLTYMYVGLNNQNNQNNHFDKIQETYELYLNTPELLNVNFFQSYLQKIKSFIVKHKMFQPSSKKRADIDDIITIMVTTIKFYHNSKGTQPFKIKSQNLQEDFSENDLVYEDENIKIYLANTPEKCIYHAEEKICISTKKNNQFWNYRFKPMTNYFVHKSDRQSKDAYLLVDALGPEFSNPYSYNPITPNNDREVTEEKLIELYPELETPVKEGVFKFIPLSEDEQLFRNKNRSVRSMLTNLVFNDANGDIKQLDKIIQGSVLDQQDWEILEDYLLPKDFEIYLIQYTENNKVIPVYYYLKLSDSAKKRYLNIIPRYTEEEKNKLVMDCINRDEDKIKSLIFSDFYVLMKFGYHQYSGFNKLFKPENKFIETYIKNNIANELQKNDTLTPDFQLAIDKYIFYYVKNYNLDDFITELIISRLKYNYIFVPKFPIENINLNTNNLFKIIESNKSSYKMYIKDQIESLIEENELIDVEINPLLVKYYIDYVFSLNSPSIRSSKRLGEFMYVLYYSIDDPETSLQKNTNDMSKAELYYSYIVKNISSNFKFYVDLIFLNLKEEDVSTHFIFPGNILSENKNMINSIGQIILNIYAKRNEIFPDDIMSIINWSSDGIIHSCEVLMSDYVHRDSTYILKILPWVKVDDSLNYVDLFLRYAALPPLDLLNKLLEKQSINNIVYKILKLIITKTGEFRGEIKIDEKYVDLLLKNFKLTDLLLDESSSTSFIFKIIELCQYYNLPIKNYPNLYQDFFRLKYSIAKEIFTFLLLHRENVTFFEDILLHYVKKYPNIIRYNDVNKTPEQKFNELDPYLQQFLTKHKLKISPMVNESSNISFKHYFIDLC